MKFDRQRYLEEMTRLFESARDQFLERTTDTVIFVISVWTDPDAAASAVSFETRAHSDAFTEMPGVPNDSPADFQFRDIAKCDHLSIPGLWEETTSGGCWNDLEPALNEAAEIAARVFASLPLEENATLGVNSRRDWFDQRWALNTA